MKKIFNLENLPIIILIVIIFVSIAVFLGRYLNITNSKEKESVKSSITMEEAKQKAIEIFTSLGEQELNENDIEILKTKRDDIEYYYIKSKINTIELEIKGGNINRINDHHVEK